MLESLWRHLLVALGSLWVTFVLVWSRWDHSGDTFGSHWGHVGYELGTKRRPAVRTWNARGTLGHSRVLITRLNRHLGFTLVLKGRTSSGRRVVASLECQVVPWAIARRPWGPRFQALWASEATKRRRAVRTWNAQGGLGHSRVLITRLNGHLGFTLVLMGRTSTGRRIVASLECRVVPWAVARRPWGPRFQAVWASEAAKRRRAMRTWNAQGTLGHSRVLITRLNGHLAFTLVLMGRTSTKRRVVASLECRVVPWAVARRPWGPRFPARWATEAAKRRRAVRTWNAAGTLGHSRLLITRLNGHLAFTLVLMGRTSTRRRVVASLECRVVPRAVAGPP